MPDVNGDMYVLFNRYSWYYTHGPETVHMA